MKPIATSPAGLMTFKALLHTLPQTTISLEELLVFMTTRRSKLLLTIYNLLQFRFSQSILELSGYNFKRFQMIFFAVFKKKTKLFFVVSLGINLETGSSILRYVHYPLPVITISTTHTIRPNLFLPNPHLLPTGLLHGLFLDSRPLIIICLHVIRSYDEH